ncbi:MAG TPA: glycosyltransferase family 2 protein [bacterium]|nr:glycosyltransferase family 2 protein [Chlamydiota bacterium]HOE26902.1 glycosyltransferase family 2 protein [bacterium]HQM52691.1 glycosyltransferase family 2 protein [bacterium]
MAAKPALSVIISCFNEEESIGECLRRTMQAVPDAEILVIHGGSDKTADIAEEMARGNPKITVIRNLDDRGKGHAIKVGIRRSSADVMVQFDADLQFMPEEIPKVVRPILAGEADFSFGARFMKESDVERYDFSFFRVMGNRIVNRYVNLLTRQRFCDITTGFKAWTRDAIESVAFKDDRFIYEAEIAVRAGLAGRRFAMVPITYFNRYGGISGHGRGWKEPVSIIWTGVKILIFSTLIRLSLW